ncbi:phosphoribosylaminoimidazolesuccinocarboxamide synthase [Holospora curviuscula]|uniref:Phosphoribosylaminoimidazole-succinocarboxamide synthase n=1 Tax=Holospora curviuscula TaxID=1082868 RepID=A0A2S5R6P7_9PROT|nr:phosphoribosylaminoimidazolesuccinocarboxamide synthase [Holospora curviuscula]PPE03001.1 Phosphoribosylaminoimidazole-succinocarboxamide synthase [Holospora curviuscula]
MEKKIISQNPGRIVYATSKETECFHYFTDIIACPISGKEIELPGKGVINHRVSGFFFSKLQQLNIPTHFIRMLNMRQSLMHTTLPLAFDVRVICSASSVVAKEFNVQANYVFPRPIIEYIHIGTGRLLNETHLMAFSMLEMQDFDELHNTVLRVVDSMKGMCIGMRFQLMELKLQLGCGLNYNTDSPFLLCGDFSPESFSVLDLETNIILGGENITNAVYPPNLHYRNIAARLGIGLGGPSRSQVLSFQIKEGVHECLS